MCATANSWLFTCLLLVCGSMLNAFILSTLVSDEQLLMVVCFINDGVFFHMCCFLFTMVYRRVIVLLIVDAALQYAVCEALH